MPFTNPAKARCVAKKIAEGRCLTCGQAPVGPSSTRLCERCASRYRTNQIANRQRQRLEVIAAYGGCCQCCGETIPEFLTIDHIHNDGAAERKTQQSGTWYAKLKKLGWPKDRYQLLCWNCNSAKGIHGYCPHQPNEGKIVTQAGYSLRKDAA